MVKLFFGEQKQIKACCLAPNDNPDTFVETLKSAIKAFDAAVAAGDKEKAMEAYKFACKKVDKAVTKGIYHKNKAAHQKSQRQSRVYYLCVQQSNFAFLQTLPRGV